MVLIHSFHMPKPSQYSLISLTREIPFYSSSHMHLFIPNSIHYIPFVFTHLTKFSNTSFQEHSLLFSQHISYPMPLFRAMALVWRLLAFIDTYRHSIALSPFLYCSAHYSAHPKLYTPESFTERIPFILSMHLAACRFLLK